MGIYLSYASRGRNAWWRWLLTALLACLFAGLLMTLLSVILAFSHLLPPGAAQQLAQPSNPVMFFGGIALVFGLFVVGLIAAARLVQRKWPGDIIGQWRWPLFLYGVAGWGLIQALLAAVDFAIAPQGFSFSGHSGALTVAFSALAGLLVQTFAEEFVFRGYVTQAILLAVRRPLPAACISGVLFGAVHIPNGAPQALNAVCFGIVCALIAIRTGGIALTCGLHLANNYFGALVVVSADDVFKNVPGLIVQNTPQLKWWDPFLSILVLVALPWLLTRLRITEPAGKHLIRVYQVFKDRADAALVNIELMQQK